MTQIKGAGGFSSNLLDPGSSSGALQRVGQTSEPSFELGGPPLEESQVADELVSPRSPAVGQGTLGEAAAMQRGVAQQPGGSQALGRRVVSDGLVEVDIGPDQRVIGHG